MKNKNIIIYLICFFVLGLLHNDSGFLEKQSKEKLSCAGSVTSIESGYTVFMTENKNALFGQTKKVDETKAPAASSGNPDDNVLTQVLIVVLLIWAALGIFLFQIDRKVSRLERKLDEL